MKIYSLIKSEIVSITAVISVFLILYPVYVWNNETIANFLSLAFILFSLVAQLFIDKKIGFRISFLFYIYYFAYIFLRNFYDGHVDFSKPMLITMLFLLLTKYNIKRSFYLFYYLLVLFFSISLVFYACQYFFNIFSLSEIAGIDKRSYYYYPFNVVLKYNYDVIITKLIPLPRFYSILQEPGWVGTFCGIILCAFKLNIKKNKSLIIFLISGILTFSLAFYLVIFIFSILYFSPIKILKYLVPLFFMLYLISPELIENRVLNRVRISDTGSISGDNRVTDSFNHAFNDFLKSSKAWVGKGGGAHTEFNHERGGVSSWKTIIYNYGWIGFILYLLIFFSVFLENMNFSRFAFIFLFIFLINMYHRTIIHNAYFLIFLYGALIIDKNELTNNKYSYEE